MRDVALDPPRALGPPLGRGRVRAEPEDFQVDEVLGFAPSGTGQHVLLKVRKRNANTEWVARALARVAGCRPADVGFAGLKDRRAVATQWFSVPRTASAPHAWEEARIEDCEVLEAHAHSRKLPRGALAGNRFTIRVRDLQAGAVAVEARVSEIARRGVPNYFGPQRFGRDGGNLARLEQGAKAWSPRERGFVLSAARSLIFNAVLAERVRDGSWDRLEAGDIANLDGRGSIFPVSALEPDLVERCARLDLHPTGPLWGCDAPPSTGRIQELERRMADRFPIARDATMEAGMRQERRSLRMAVRELTWELANGNLTLSFQLGRGSFATTVLREILDATLAEEGEG